MLVVMQLLTTLNNLQLNQYKFAELGHTLRSITQITCYGTFPTLGYPTSLRAFQETTIWWGIGLHFMINTLRVCNPRQWSVKYWFVRPKLLNYDTALASCSYHFRVCVNSLKCLISVFSVSRHVIAALFCLVSRSNTWECVVYLLSAGACYSRWRGSSLTAGPSSTCHSSLTSWPVVSRQSQIIIWKYYSTFCCAVAPKCTAVIFNVRKCKYSKSWCNNYKIQCSKRIINGTCLWLTDLFR